MLNLYCNGIGAQIKSWDVNKLKTLSAETIAEKQQRPLYMVSVGELGTNVQSLEENLRNILDIATTWNAVLLLDEADIFLEARTELDIERNAMVGVFLRMLEYHQGIMFLTTNRATNLDEAFFSRISLAIDYHPLTAVDRVKIWTNLLTEAELKIVNMGYLSAHDINGRQIKNAINSARSLAAHHKRDVAMSDFERVITKAEQFQRVMDTARSKHGKKDTILGDDAEILREKKATALEVNFTESKTEAAAKALGYKTRQFNK